MNELMLVSDVLVTDYSSAIYEFALLGRPMAFFAPDEDAYDLERGFYFDFRGGLPGPDLRHAPRTSPGYLRAGDFDLERVRAFAADELRRRRRAGDRAVRSRGRGPGHCPRAGLGGLDPAIIRHRTQAPAPGPEPP